MEIPKKYDPISAEQKWYQYWLDHDVFSSTPDEREPYTIVIPPPNVTGILHMGHMLNNTIQDVLIRRARMQGKNACWVPGTDHASIATEAKVVARLESQGIKKADLTRKEFLKHAFEWKEEFGGIILNQLKKLGASCDWNRTRFTMDDTYSEKVIDTFIDLYNKGKVYRGARMINWDPQALTALSDEEVNYTEENSKLYYVRYQIEGSEEYLTIATTRPETILGDSAICVNPNDERYQHLKDKKAIVPLVNRSIPIIFDEYVDIEFGTGCLKVTPAHDINDYELGRKYNLEVINVLDEKGTISEAGQLFVGEDRFEVRKKIGKELDEAGNLVKIEDYQNKVGRSERTNAIIEPRISTQWFCNMEEMAKPALDHVMDDTIKFYPANSKNTYKHWMENIKDWCVSRQLWWGHQIPAWFYGEGMDDFVVAKTQNEALSLAKEKSGDQTLQLLDLKQDEDVMDTWFSSWLWPFGVFDQPEEVAYYYPTNSLVTAPDIMFFWVARMIMAGYEYKDEKPFSHVYFTGLIRDKQGRKMSKQLGNSPDALKLIEQYGADGVRSGLLLTSAAGNDLLFQDEEKNGEFVYPQCEQGRNFSNKIWNAFRLIKSWEIADIDQPAHAAKAVEWFDAKLNKTLLFIDDQFEKYRISDALMATYKLIWDDFCSWYLELVKPAYQKPIDKKTYQQTTEVFEQLLQILHPFMPFVSEEIYQYIGERKEGETICTAQWPEAQKYDAKVINDFELASEVITNIRTFRKENNVPNKDQIELTIKPNESKNDACDAIIVKLGNLSSLDYSDEKVDNSFSFVIKSTEYFIPFGDNIDLEVEREKIEEELKYTKGFLTSVEKKLSNERFVNSAPEKVVDGERKKQADAQSKIKVLEEKLATLS